MLSIIGMELKVCLLLSSSRGYIKIDHVTKDVSLTPLFNCQTAAGCQRS